MLVASLRCDGDRDADPIPHVGLHCAIEHGGTAEGGCYTRQPPLRNLDDVGAAETPPISRIDVLNVTGVVDRLNSLRNLIARLNFWVQDRREDWTSRTMSSGDAEWMNPSSAEGAIAQIGVPAAESEIVSEGVLVRLRSHVVANRPAFQRWYADEEIARLLRHDQRPLDSFQSRGYFDTIIMPLSARRMCFAIHEASTDELIGTTALTDVEGSDNRSALFRIVIGEKDRWGRGYGTEATRLVVEEAFGWLDLDQIRLEVFRHNTRAIAAYRRIGFREMGEHVEYVGRERFALHVIEMRLDRDDYLWPQPAEATSLDGDDRLVEDENR